MRIEELQAVPQDQWATELVGDHVRTDFPTLPSTVTVREASPNSSSASSAGHSTRGYATQSAPGWIAKECSP